MSGADGECSSGSKRTVLKGEAGVCQHQVVSSMDTGRTSECGMRGRAQRDKVQVVVFVKTLQQSVQGLSVFEEVSSQWEGLVRGRKGSERLAGKAEGWDSTL